MKKKWVKKLIYIVTLSTCFLILTPPANTDVNIRNNDEPIIMNLHNHGIGTL